MTESYWRIPQDENTKQEVPLRDLKEQATLLSEQTRSLLRGYVRSRTVGDELVITMYIIVPTLNNYRVELLEYRQPPAMFPGDLQLAFPPDSVQVETYQQFAETLRRYLSSTEVSRVVQSLLSQAKA